MEVLNVFVKWNSSEYWKRVEFNRFGLLPILITVQSCLGSIAVCYACELDEHLQVAFLMPVAVVTMASNATAIAQAPMKWVVFGFILSVIVSTSVIIISNTLI